MVVRVKRKSHIRRKTNKHQKTRYKKRSTKKRSTKKISTKKRRNLKGGMEWGYDKSVGLCPTDYDLAQLSRPQSPPSMRGEHCDSPPEGSWNSFQFEEGAMPTGETPTDADLALLPSPLFCPLYQEEEGGAAAAASTPKRARRPSSAAAAAAADPVRYIDKQTKHCAACRGQHRRHTCEKKTQSDSQRWESADPSWHDKDTAEIETLQRLKKQGTRKRGDPEPLHEDQLAAWRWKEEEEALQKGDEWTPAEDALLRGAVKGYGPEWVIINQTGCVPGRGAASLRHRWTRLGHLGQQEGPITEIEINECPQCVPGSKKPIGHRGRHQVNPS